MTQRREPIEDPGLDKKVDGQMSTVPENAYNSAAVFDLRNYGGPIGFGKKTTGTVFSSVFVSTFPSNSSTALPFTAQSSFTGTGFWRPVVSGGITGVNTSGKVNVEIGATGIAPDVISDVGIGYAYTVSTSGGGNATTGSGTAYSFPVTKTFDVPSGGGITIEATPNYFNTDFDFEWATTGAGSVQNQNIKYPFYGANGSGLISFDPTKSMTADASGFVSLGSVQKVSWDTKATY